MAKQPKSTPLPKIVLGDGDHEKLLGLSGSLSGKLAEMADQILEELDRAKVIPQEQLPPSVVRMGSTVSFETSDGARHRFTLVYPDMADIESGRISILTPIGAALIGLSEGQSIPWRARDGRVLTLTVLNVGQEV